MPVLVEIKPARDWVLISVASAGGEIFKGGASEMRKMIVATALMAGLLCLGLIISADGHGRHLRIGPPAVLARLMP